MNNPMYVIYLGQREPRKALIELRGNKSREEVAKALDISVLALAAYEERIREPRDEVKVRIIDYYGTKNIKFTTKRINAANTDQSISCI